MRPPLPRLLEDNRDAIAEVCRRFGVERLEVFGSAADGRFDAARSDVDFIVRFATEPTERLPRRFFGLADALETMLGRRVDLMIDEPIRNRFLRRAVEASRREFYVAETAKHLEDAAMAARLALRFLAGRDLDAYRSDDMLRSAVERQVEIVGEACRRALRDSPELAARLPDVSRAIAMRNRLAHGYDTLDHAVVFATVTGDYPPLAVALERGDPGLGVRPAAARASRGSLVRSQAPARA
ncbi:MAG: DUF86 domain-containing protein [Comamonadaceae bacterium]|nr:DUF86 domain-containing protein [Comamonadaceae bacterium]